MDFESPEESKVFPGLYKAESGKSLEQAEYEEEEKKKKKKDSKKDKGYAALAGESSPDEDELDQKSPASKVKKLKAPFKLSAKKKDKKSEEKESKPKEKEKKSDKDKIKLAEKEKKSLEKEKKVEKELKKSLEKEKEKEKERKSIEKERKLSEKSNEKEKKPEKPPSTSELKEKPEKKSIEKERRPFSSSIEVEREGAEEKSSGGLNQAINAFLNAPAPILSKKFKEAKKLEKQLSIGSSTKAKLKLKRSKNSLEDSPNAEPPFTPTHQFPEDAESLGKEIKKYEALLEQTHSHIKSSKKVSKKNEEQLWELQRTLTQLKRKLRSVNVLSATEKSCHRSSIPSGKNDIEQQQPQPPKLPIEEIEKVREVKEEEEEEIQLDFTLKTSGNISDSSSYDLKRDGSISIQSPCPHDEVFESVKEVNKSRSRSKSPANSTPNELETVHVRVDVHHPVESQNTPVEELLEIANFEKAAKSIEFEKCPPPLIVRPPEPILREPQTLDETFEKEDDFDISEHEETMMEGDESELCMSHVNKKLDFDSCLATQENSEDESLVTDDEDYDDELFREFHDGDELHERDLIPSGISEELAQFDPFQLPIFETEDFLMAENKALKLFNENLTEEIKNEEMEINKLMEDLLQMKADGVDIDAPEVSYDLSDYDMDELVSLWQVNKLENESLNDNVNTLRSMVASSKLHEFLLETRLKYLEGKALEENPLIINDNEVVPLLQSEI